MEPKQNPLQKKILIPSNSQKSANDGNFISIADDKAIKGNDSNFIFFFGKASIGKSVILASMLYYMNARAGSIRPKPETPNTKEAEILLFDLLDDIKRGILPKRTVIDQVTRIDLVFEPNNKSKKIKPINLTFLEMAGDNLYQVRRGGNFHRSIDEYLNADIPLNFILVTDYNNADEDDSLMISFLNELERKSRKYKKVNAILVISKWDMSGSMGIPSKEHLNNFISDHMPMTNNQLDNYELFKTYYTVGEVYEDEESELSKLRQLNLTTAKMLTEWLYYGITGIDINDPGTFIERLFGK